jgi:HEAT repeat protein
MAAAMSSLARVDSTHALQWLPRYLITPSRHEILASTALGLISRADSAHGVKLALERVRAGQPARLRGQALSILRRPLKHSPEVEQIFIGLLGDRNRWIRWSAVNALGDAGGQAALHSLEAIAANSDDELMKQAREAAQKITMRLNPHE